MIKFHTPDQFEVPRHTDMGGSGAYDDPTKWGDPFTGNGFTKSATDPIPEWQPQSNGGGAGSATLDEGAEMWTITKNGEQRARGRLRRRPMGGGQVSDQDLRGSTNYAFYAGRELVVAFQNREAVALEDGGGPFPDAVQRGEAEGRRWVKVPGPTINRMYRRTVTAEWGGRRVEVVKVRGESVGFWFRGDPEWAHSHGLAGSMHEGGWGGTAPTSELGAVTTTDTDRLIPGSTRSQP